MKKLIFLFGMSVIFQQSNACDVCGCGVGNYNPHMFPHLSKSFINIGYTYRHYYTHLHVNGGTTSENNEYYKTQLVAAQYSPFKNVQLMGILPFQMNRQIGEEGDKKLQQLGDVVFLANYRLFDHASGSGQIRQTFIAGAGIKLPTGKYSFNENDETQVHNVNFQAGSGSVDWLLNTSYNFSYRNWAIGSGITYKINNANKQDYKFGNRLLGITQLKYIQNIGDFSLIPHIGINYENLQTDRSSGKKVEHTGGSNLQLTTGIDINSKNWALGFMYLQPVKQTLADGEIHAKPGINLNLSYSF